MKVFLVNSTKTWGGGEKWHFETACTLHGKGHSIAILALNGKELYKRSVAAGIGTLPVSISNISFINPIGMIKLIRLFRHEKPDAVILNFSADIKSAGVAAKCAGIRNIIYRRGSAIPIRNTIINRLLYGKIITHMIANSEETKHTVLQNNSKLFPAGKIEVIYNGIDLAQLNRLPDTEIYPRRKGELVLGNVGRLVSQKGQKYLIELARILEKKKLDFKMLIGGEGPLEASLKQYAVESGVAEHIVFTGFVSNIKAFMNNIDIFILTSTWEGFGYVLVEAMACGKPVIAFNISSNPEIVVNNETGILTNPMDVTALAAQVEYLGNHPDICLKFGQAGKKRVAECFDFIKNQHKVEDLLTGLVDQCNG